jgi:hypothetical protein
MKLRSLYGLQGDLDLLCRQVEAAPSLAADYSTLNCRLCDIDDRQSRQASEISADGNSVKTKAIELADNGATQREISIDGNEVSLAGKTYSLPDDQAAFIQALVAARPGVWVPGPQMGEMVQPRPDRVFKKLPEPIRAKIESGRGKGFRFVTT